MEKRLGRWVGLFQEMCSKFRTPSTPGTINVPYLDYGIGNSDKPVLRRKNENPMTQSFQQVTICNDARTFGIIEPFYKSVFQIHNCRILEIRPIQTMKLAIQFSPKYLYNCIEDRSLRSNCFEKGQRPYGRHRIAFTHLCKNRADSALSLTEYHRNRRSLNHAVDSPSK